VRARVRGDYERSRSIESEQSGIRAQVIGGMMKESMAKVKIACFNGQGDFSMWKKRMMAHLSILGLKDALIEVPTTSGSEIEMKKGEAEEDFKERIKKLELEKPERAEKAMNMIILSRGDHVLRKLEEYTTAATIWSALERLYNSKTLSNRIHLQHKFYTFKMQKSKSIDENIDDFLKLVSGLRSVNVSVSEEVQAILLLSSLPSQYKQLKETPKYGMDTLTIEDVTNAAKSKEIEHKEVRSQVHLKDPVMPTLLVVDQTKGRPTEEEVPTTSQDRDPDQR